MFIPYRLYRIAEYDGSLSSSWCDNHYMVKSTGEFRPPKEGEWYISGNPPEGYKAPNDLTTSFYIAVVYKVKVETKVIIHEKEIVKNPSFSEVMKRIEEKRGLDNE